MTVSYLEPDITTDKILSGIDNLEEKEIWAVVVNLYHLFDVKVYLQDTKIKLAAAAAYPLGCNTVETKIEQLKYAVEMHADEIYFQLNYNAVKSRDWDYVNEEIKRMNDAAGEEITVITLLETGIMCAEEKNEIYQLISRNNIRNIQLGSKMVAPASKEDIDIFTCEYGDKVERIDVYDKETADRMQQQYWGEKINYLYMSIKGKNDRR